MQHILIVITIRHKAHEPFWEAIYNKKFYHFPFYDKPLLRYLGALRIPKNFDIYLIEDLLPFAYLKYSPFLRNKIWISIVADALSYIYFYQPKWYFEERRLVKIKLPKVVRKFYLHEMAKGLKILDGAIAVSNLVKKYLKKVIDVPVEVVYPAINPINFQDIKNAKINMESNNLFSISVTGTWKGIDLMLDSFKLVLKEFKDTKLYLRTSIHLIKIYWKEMKPLIKERKLVILKRRVKWSEIAKQTFIYLQTSYFDPCPVSVFEAGYMGMVPIVTKYVGSSEIYKDKFKSLIRDLYPEDIAEGIMKILEKDIEERRKLSEEIKEKSKVVEPEKVKEEFKKKFKLLLDEIL